MELPTRRQWLQTTGAAAALTLAPQAFGQDEPFKAAAAALQPAGFTLPKLPYAFDALEPYIDAKTMEIHHDRHHKAYIDNLNKVGWADGKSIEDVLLTVLRDAPETIRTAVINNGGGHYNHSMFWQIMGRNGGKPSSELLAAYGGTLYELKKAVKEKALSQFGSGWAWVVCTKPEKKLVVMSTANQDCPLMAGGFPVLGIDVWEHAYYLKYQNKRADYVDAWWNVVNWDAVNDRFKMAMKG